MPARVDVDVRRFVAFVETPRVPVWTCSNEVSRSACSPRWRFAGLLSDVLRAGGMADELVEPLRLMRRYSVRFLERIGAIEDRHDPQASSRHPVP